MKYKDGGQVQSTNANDSHGVTKYQVLILVGLLFLNVAVNRENDTCFENGLVMGYTDSKYFADLVEASKVVSNVSLALCQTHCKQVPMFSCLSKSH